MVLTCAHKEKLALSCTLGSAVVVTCVHMCSLQHFLYAHGGCSLGMVGGQCSLSSSIGQCLRSCTLWRGKVLAVLLGRGTHWVHVGSTGNQTQGLMFARPLAINPGLLVPPGLPQGTLAPNLTYSLASLAIPGGTCSLSSFLRESVLSNSPTRSHLLGSSICLSRTFGLFMPKTALSPPSPTNLKLPHILHLRDCALRAPERPPCLLAPIYLHSPILVPLQRL